MADPVTPNYGLILPIVDDPAGEDLWGDKVNANFTSIDAIIKNFDTNFALALGNKQDKSAYLTALVGTSALNGLIRNNGSGVLSAVTLGAFGPTILNTANSDAALGVLGATATGKAFVVAANAAAAQTALGASATGKALIVAADAAAAQTAIGATTVGKALIVAASADAAQGAIGATSTGKALIIAATPAAARTAIDFDTRVNTFSGTNWAVGADGLQTKLAAGSLIINGYIGGSPAVWRPHATGWMSAIRQEGTGDVGFVKSTASTGAGGAAPMKYVWFVTPDGNQMLVNRGAAASGGNFVIQQNQDASFTQSGFSMLNAGANLAMGFLIDTSNNFCLGRSGATIGYFNSTSGTYTATSDQRLKQDIVPIQDAVNKVMLLNPIEYAFIREPDARVSGFSAQEVEQVIPTAVYSTTTGSTLEGGTKTLDVNQIVPYLTAALQYAITKADELAVRVEQLEGVAENG